MISTNEDAKTIMLYLIPEHDKKRITARQICQMVGISQKTVRKCVNTLRQEGVPVCSDRKGYYISNTPECVNATIAHLKHRINQIQAAIDGLEKRRGK